MATTPAESRRTTHRPHPREWRVARVISLIRKGVEIFIAKNAVVEPLLPQRSSMTPFPVVPGSLLPGADRFGDEVRLMINFEGHRE
jgi:hypothetical protein